MRFLTRMLALCAFIAGMGTAPSLLAAEENLPAAAPEASQTQNVAPESKLPDISLEGKARWSAEESRKKDAVCTRCHDESETLPILSIYQTKHGARGDARTPNCQTCHGESEKHLKGDPNVKGRAAPDIIFKKGAFELSDNKARAGQCISCHKGTKRNNWDGGQHDNNQVACNDCHKVHAPADKVLSKKTQTAVCFTCHKEQRAQSHKISTHPIDAGKVVCSDCHNPHGSSGPKLLKKATVTETCFTCHAEKRGPFLWEHQPVTEDCTNCHTPHGSNISPLLKSRAPFLCQECHDGPHNSKTPYGSLTGGGQAVPGSPTLPNENAAGRGCTNCHSMVHGSNHPAGALLHR